jgi:hypothetical protein
MAMVPLFQNDRMVVERLQTLDRFEELVSSILFFGLCQIRKFKKQANSTSKEMSGQPVRISNRSQ